MNVLGLDIGGANLKASDGLTGWSTPFALYRDPSGLPRALRSLCRTGEPDLIAVTMTGELADCYATRAVGVREILAAVEQAFSGSPCVVWQTAGEFVPPATAAEVWRLTASANWHALATFAGRVAPEGDSLVVDCGSTTTDLVPLTRGFVDERGLTDEERLASGSLVYTGCGRTPAFALGNGRQLAVGATRSDDREAEFTLVPEFFATAADVWQVATGATEPAWNGPTADGRGHSLAEARQRLARQMCSDAGDVATVLQPLAQKLCERQVSEVLQAYERVVSSDVTTVIASGSGRPLIDALLTRLPQHPSVVWLADVFDAAVAAAAPAFAVARLAEERVVIAGDS